MQTLAPPTKRELALTAFLLLFLVTFFKNDVTLEPSSASPLLSFAGLSLHRKNVLPALDPHARLDWSSDTVPQTTIISHVPGWTTFDRLYVLNSTLYIVTTTPDSVPERKFMTSTAVKIGNSAEEVAARMPGDREMRIISPEDAKILFGAGANRVEGVTWLANDPPQFITHYYHWSAELFFGFWRAYSSLDPLIHADGQTELPPPRRMIFTHADAAHWRDYASMDQYVLRATFPSIVMEFSADWADRAAMGVPFVYDRVVLADRAAAFNGENFGRTQRTAAEPFTLPGGPSWWSTVRENVIDWSGVAKDVGRGTRGNPVITYVSRQDWGRRMLIQEDHEKLVAELYKLRDEYGYEVNVVSMDKLSRVEQLRLAARTTIMMGVHGNGLTSLIWMNPTPRTTVMEFFYPGGFAHDYEWTTRALGMVHYGFWGDSAFTSPDVPAVAYPEGFQGNSIPIDGALVARICHQRLTLGDEADD